MVKLNETQYDRLLERKRLNKHGEAHICLWMLSTLSMSKFYGLKLKQSQNFLKNRNKIVFNHARFLTIYG